ncbi:Ig-like domain-containing protein [Curtobacterium sp. NPDC090217]|uniref:Ig-like domain-containing protein n=1 Tax=Curtobacterium sp. NPDC090217 TaxID=3363970 RepID=UPI00380167ED
MLLGTLLAVVPVLSVPLLGGAPALAAATAACAPTGEATNCVQYTFSGGDQTFTVPTGVTAITASVSGAGGGRSSNNENLGGVGGLAAGTFAVTGGDDLVLTVGGVGAAGPGGAGVYGGGGAGGNGSRGSGGAGGGLSAIWSGASFASAPVLVAGGGGGASGAGGSVNSGGTGGGTVGADGASVSDNRGGRGGTQTAGGAAGFSGATTGAQYAGGAGADGTDAGGGGGAGWFGGGGGGAQPAISGNNNDGGGGGGSGYLGTTVTGGVLTSGGGAARATAGTITLQWTAPAPVIETPLSGTTIAPTATISGTAVGGNTVRVFNGSTLVCTATAESSGAWSCTPDAPLANGSVTFSAQQTDDPTNTLQRYPVSAAVTATVDAVPPTEPTITAPADGDAVGDTTPTFSGTGDEGDTVELRADDGTVLCSVVVPPGGAWTCTPTTAFGEGDTTVTPVAIDAAGNETAGTAVTITVDVTPPTAPVVTAPADGDSVGDSTPTFSGTGDEGDRVELRADDGTVLCSVVVPPGGAWTCTPTDALPEGANTITPVTVDAAGNETAGESLTVTVDTVPPTAPVVTAPADGDSVGDTTPTFSGTGDEGDTVELRADDGTVLCSVVVPPGGAWTCTPTDALPEGANTITPVTVDAAGNETAGTALTITVDVTPPTAPVVTAPADGESVGDTTPTFSGTGDEGDTVELRADDGTVLCSVVIPPGGAWTCTPTDALPEGANTITPVTVDAAGNETAGESLTVTVDTVPPTAPVVTAPVDGESVGDSTPAFSGTGDEGDRVELRADDGTVLCSVVVPPGGAWTCTPTTAFGEGDTTVTPVAIDAAGNETAGTAVTVTVDVTPPTAPTDVVCAVNPDGTVSCGGTGAEAGNEVVVRDGDGNEVCRVTVPDSLEWSCTTTDPVAVFPLSVVEVDQAGNESSAVTTPSPATITSPADGAESNDSTPTFAGTGTVGDTVQLRDSAGNTVCETTVGPDGRWSCTPSEPLPEGSSTITPVVISADGSEFAGRAVSVVVDTTAPAPAENVVCAQNPNGTVTCSGTADPGSTVRITLPDGTELCTVQVVAPGQWSCTTTVPVDADNLLVTVTDSAGNVSTSVSVSVVPFADGNGGSGGSGGSVPGGDGAGTGDLAFTGADLAGASATALVLLALGALGLWRGSRRRRTQAAEGSVH